ncbi:hypothetical protein [Streptomyces broussonetiae]|uniref:hypothetical protein n=1 Tax=Streptomyces broussonetiae TaxID=2686304 RepID=UPI0035D8C615
MDDEGAVEQVRVPAARLRGRVGVCPRVVVLSCGPGSRVARALAADPALTRDRTTARCLPGCVALRTQPGRAVLGDGQEV